MTPLIAVVDDDQETLDMIADMLTAAGYRTITSSDHGAVHELLLRERPNLVVLDLMMGRAYLGWTLLSLIRADPATAHLPVLMLSANVAFLQAQQERLSERGCDTLDKPFTMDALLAKVAAALDGASPSRWRPSTGADAV